MKPVDHVTITKDMKINDLAKAFEKSGVFQAGKLGLAVDIAERMFKDKDCRIFLGIAGAMVPGGMKGIIHDILKSGRITALVTTGATLTHDMVEGLGEHHYQGSEYADDEKLNKQGLDRMYNSYMSNKVYGLIEDYCKEVFPKLKKEMNIQEFLHEFGKHAPKNTILRICADNDIKLFCPALADSGLGLQVWNFLQSNKIKIDAFGDLNVINDLSWTAKRSGVIYIGGGVPKNYIQQAMQFAPKPAEYGIQLTVDREAFGGSSGAPLKEGISWGKMNPKGNFVDVICEATISLPLLWAGLKSRI